MPQKVAALVEEGFEDLELFHPKFRLEEAGFEVDVLTPDGKERKGEYGYPIKAEKSIGEANVQDYAALLLPGGVKNPDRLRVSKSAVEFVRAFVTQTDGPVFAICHGPWTLVNANVLDDVEMTSYHSLRADLENAGARRRDAPVVVSGRFVTSRHPGDLPEFGRAIVEALAGAHAEARAPAEAAGAARAR